MKFLLWTLAILWLAVLGGFAVTSAFRRDALRRAELAAASRKVARSCEAVAMRAVPSGWRFADPDAATAAGPATKLAGKYAVRDISRGERICDQDVAATPRVAARPGFAALVIPAPAGPLNAGAVVDLRAAKNVIRDVRVAAILCGAAGCNQALVELPEAEVQALLAADNKDVQFNLVTIRSLP